MKKVLIFLLALCFILPCASSCNKESIQDDAEKLGVLISDIETHSDYVGVSLELTSVEEKNGRFILNTILKSQYNDLVCYDWYTIERKEGDSWTDVAKSENAATDLTYIVKEQEEVKKSYSTESFDISK